VNDQTQTITAETFITAKDFARYQRPISLYGATVELPGKGYVICANTDEDGSIALVMEREGWMLPGEIVNVDPHTQLNFFSFEGGSAFYPIEWDVRSVNDMTATMYVNGIADDFSLAITIYLNRRYGAGKPVAAVNWPALGSQPVDITRKFASALSHANWIAEQIEVFANQ
jgi:hypothetical protein